MESVSSREPLLFEKPDPTVNNTSRINQKLCPVHKVRSYLAITSIKPATSTQNGTPPCPKSKDVAVQTPTRRGSSGPTRHGSAIILSSSSRSPVPLGDENGSRRDPYEDILLCNSVYRQAILRHLEVALRSFPINPWTDLASG